MPFAVVVQVLSALPSPRRPGFSVLRNASHGCGVKAATSRQDRQTDARTHTQATPTFSMLHAETFSMQHKKNWEWPRGEANTDNDDIVAQL